MPDTSSHRYRRSRITLADVATVAGATGSTVDNLRLGNAGKVTDPALRQRIWAALRWLGYPMDAELDAALAQSVREVAEAGLPESATGAVLELVQRRRALVLELGVAAADAEEQLDRTWRILAKQLGISPERGYPLQFIFDLFDQIDHHLLVADPQERRAAGRSAAVREIPIWIEAFVAIRTGSGAVRHDSGWLPIPTRWAGRLEFARARWAQELMARLGITGAPELVMQPEGSGMLREFARMAELPDLQVLAVLVERLRGLAELVETVDLLDPDKLAGKLDTMLAQRDRAVTLRDELAERFELSATDLSAQRTRRTVTARDVLQAAVGTVVAEKFADFDAELLSTGLVDAWTRTLKDIPEQYRPDGVSELLAQRDILAELEQLIRHTQAVTRLDAEIQRLTELLAPTAAAVTPRAFAELSSRTQDRLVELTAAADAQLPPVVGDGADAKAAELVRRWQQTQEPTWPDLVDGVDVVVLADDPSNAAIGQYLIENAEKMKAAGVEFFGFDALAHEVFEKLNDREISEIDPDDHPDVYCGPSDLSREILNAMAAAGIKVVPLGMDQTGRPTAAQEHEHMLGAVTRVVPADPETTASKMVVLAGSGLVSERRWASGLVPFGERVRNARPTRTVQFAGGTASADALTIAAKQAGVAGQTFAVTLTENDRGYGKETTDVVLHLAQLTSYLRVEEIRDAWHGGAPAYDPEAGDRPPRDVRELFTGPEAAFWHALFDGDQSALEELRRALTPNSRDRRPLPRRWAAWDAAGADGGSAVEVPDNRRDDEDVDEQYQCAPRVVNRIGAGRADMEPMPPARMGGTLISEVETALHGTGMPGTVPLLSQHVRGMRDAIARLVGDAAENWNRNAPGKPRVLLVTMNVPGQPGYLDELVLAELNDDGSYRIEYHNHATGEVTEDFQPTGLQADWPVLALFITEYGYPITLADETGNLGFRQPAEDFKVAHSDSPDQDGNAGVPASRVPEEKTFAELSSASPTTTGSTPPLQAETRPDRAPVRPITGADAAQAVRDRRTALAAELRVPWQEADEQLHAVRQQLARLLQIDPEHLHWPSVLLEVVGEAERLLSYQGEAGWQRVLASARLGKLVAWIGSGVKMETLRAAVRTVSRNFSGAPADLFEAAANH